MKTLPADQKQEIEWALLEAWKLVHPGDRDQAPNAWKIVRKLERQLERQRSS